MNPLGKVNALNQTGFVDQSRRATVVGLQDVTARTMSRAKEIEAQAAQLLESLRPVLRAAPPDAGEPSNKVLEDGTRDVPALAGVLSIDDSLRCTQEVIAYIATYLAL